MDWGLWLKSLKGRVISLDLLDTLLLVQPRTPLVFWAKRALYQYMINFHPAVSSDTGTAPFNSLIPQPDLILRIALTLVQGLAAGWSSLMITKAHFSSLLWFFWMSFLPPNKSAAPARLVSSGHLQSILLSLIDKDIRVRTSEGHHFLLISIWTLSSRLKLWIQTTNHFLIHQLLHPSKPPLTNSAERITCQRSYISPGRWHLKPFLYLLMQSLLYGRSLN